MGSILSPGTGPVKGHSKTTLETGQKDMEENNAMKTIILVILVAVSGCVEEANLAEVQCHEVLDTVCALGEACLMAPAGKAPIYSPPTPEKCAEYTRSVCAKKTTAAPQADVDACLAELDAGTCTAGHFSVSDAGQQCITTWDK